MIRIDKEKCTGCLTCLSVCPFTVLEEVDGKPQLAEGKSCMACMHCAAVCTEKAISFGEQEAILQSALTKMPEGFDKELKGHILRRRSYRHFSSEKVDRKLIEEALEIASWAPSAKNQHPTKWIIIDDSTTLEKIMGHILKYAEENNISPEIISEYAAGNNVVMGTAPTMLLAYASDYAISPETDTAIAMTTAELYLQSKGVGTCWAGYFKRMCNAIPEIKELLPKIPRAHSFYGAFMMGYPKDEEYLHIPERIKRADIKWA
ncbi:MAG: nitroreductase family protein [Firmicutes bacterium]|nr:nitroreductase family protein [Bacillota bacterium]